MPDETPQDQQIRSKIDPHTASVLMTSGNRETQRELDILKHEMDLLAEKRKAFVNNVVEADKLIDPSRQFLPHLNSTNVPQSKTPLYEVALQQWEEMGLRQYQWDLHTAYTSRDPKRVHEMVMWVSARNDVHDALIGLIQEKEVKQSAHSGPSSEYESTRIWLLLAKIGAFRYKSQGTPVYSFAEIATMIADRE